MWIQPGFIQDFSIRPDQIDLLFHGFFSSPGMTMQAGGIIKKISSQIDL